MASLPTLAEIKTALGIDASDTSKDAAITSLLAATIAIVETYLGRGIIRAAVVEEFPPPDNYDPALSLFRFPVDHVNSVTQEGAALAGFRVEKEPGIVRWRMGNCFARRACCGELELPIVVDYVGGYPDDNWPADLIEAVMRSFYGRWHATGGSGNLADAVQAGGPNRSVSVDGLTITRDAASYAGDAFSGQAVPPDLVGVAAMLEPYRSRIVTGV